MRLSMTWLLCGVILAGCSSIYLKHPETKAVAECDPQRWFWPTTWWSVFPGQMLVHRGICVDEWKAKGYVEVDKCKDVPKGTLCISQKERQGLNEEE